MEAIRDLKEEEVHALQHLQLNHANLAFEKVCKEVQNYIEGKGVNYKLCNVIYITRCLYEEVSNWILFNCINNSLTYISSHQNSLYDKFVNSLAISYRESPNSTKDKEHTMELDWYGDWWKSYIYEIARIIIEDLVEIRQNYLKDLGIFKED